jgi:DNA-binding NarL/FixJ family response regulator
MGIVIHSQHEPAQVLRRFPSDDIMGWSFVPNTGNMSLDELVAMLVSTARGMSTVDSHATHETGTGSTRLSALTDRQRAVMALAAEGLNAPEIARRLGRSSESVRQDLSRAYRVLTPATGEGEDRRTRAVMEYLRLMREESWDSL